jgi:ankyrin
MDILSPITNGDSPLHVAVRQGQVEDIREILIQQQVDVNILNSKHDTPLHLACSKRDSPIVQLLVAFGADPFIKDSNNECVFDTIRSSFGIFQLMSKLLLHHDLGQCTWMDGPIQADKDSPLHTAVRLRRLDNIQRIIKEKVVDINDTNSIHETPLHLACALGHKHIIHILISNGADMYKKDYFNNAPIHRAVSQGHIDTVEYLITVCACNPNIKGYQGRTLLHFACGIGNVKLVTTLIEKYGISPMATDAVNQTPFDIAASHGQEEVVRLLIDKYNSLESTADLLTSQLGLASYCGHVTVVRTLVLEYKADINNDVFSISVIGGNIEMVQLMITEFDQDPLSANDSGYTPLHIACFCGHEELARLLITNYNSPVDVKNKIKETPLHTACLSGHSTNIIRMLVSEFKADTTQRDHNNKTAVSKAAEGGHVETVQVLITELGCSPEV